MVIKAGDVEEVATVANKAIENAEYFLAYNKAHMAESDPDASPCRAHRKAYTRHTLAVQTSCIPAAVALHAGQAAIPPAFRVRGG